MCGGESEGGVVTLLGLRHQPLLLEGVGQVTIGVGEVGLKLDGPPVGVNSEVNETLLIVDTGQVAMDNRMVRGQVKRSQVCCYCPEKKNFIVT